MESILEIVGGLAKCIVLPVGRQLGYLVFYRRNMVTLGTKCQELAIAREKIHKTIDEDRRKGKRIEADVEIWMKQVDERMEDARCLFESVQRKSRYRLSRYSTKLKKDVVKLLRTAEFTSVSYHVPPQEPWSVPDKQYEVFESRISTMEEVMEELGNLDTYMIGVYGIGGVGKTTFIKEVYREATKSNRFDDVVIVDVNQNSDLERIQVVIAKKLGMEILENQLIEERASILCSRIQDSRVLVILDEVWERIDLEALGLPRVPTCKILLTSRSRDVLSCKMHTQRDFLLDILGEEESWSLFEKMAGGVVKDPTLQTVATQVVKSCRGLPVLIVTVAGALKNRTTIHPWKDTLRRLQGFDKEELTETAYSALEWSYDRLDDKELKPLFLLCGIVGVRNYISFGELFGYAMGSGLFENLATVEEARNALHSSIEKLKDSCLFRDCHDTKSVRMHDLVCDFALKIASRDPHVLLRAYAEELKEWPDKDFLKECTAVSLLSCSVHKLPEVLECSELKMLFFRSKDDSLDVPCHLFKETKKLKVLDLANLCIPSLPQSLKNLQMLCLTECALGDIALVGELTRLETLSLSHSRIKQLPQEIGKLSLLRSLDLTGCSELEVIPPNVISTLTRLEDLRMGNSFNKWEPEGVIGERRNASLSELKHMSELIVLNVHIQDANILPAGLLTDKLEAYQIVIGEAWKWHAAEEECNKLLKLKLTTRNQLDLGVEMLLKRSESLFLDGSEFYIANEGFQQLNHLHVQNNGVITYIMNSIDESCSRTCFPVLESLFLDNLVNLESVYQGQYAAESFLNLQSLTLRKLPKLIGFSSKGSRPVVATTSVSEIESNEIILENEIGIPTQLFMRGEVLLPKLTSLIVHRCDGLRSLLSPSMARSFHLLRYLEVSECEIMEEIVSIEAAESTGDMFCKLDHLQLEHLPKLTRFCRGKSINFPSLEKLQIGNCTELETFYSYTPENTAENILFDTLGVFPSLESLFIYDLPKLETLWAHYLSPDSFSRLRAVEVSRCEHLIHIFGPVMFDRLNALHSLQIRSCESLQVVFELGRRFYRNENYETSSFGCQNLDSVAIHGCDSLKNIFPLSVARSLQQLRELTVESCGVEEIIGEEHSLETTRNFVFPKLTSVRFIYLRQLSSFYPGMHTSKCPLLKELKVEGCHKVENFVAGFSSYQDRPELDRSNQVRSLFSIEG